VPSEQSQTDHFVFLHEQISRPETESFEFGVSQSSTVNVNVVDENSTGSYASSAHMALSIEIVHPDRRSVAFAIAPVKDRPRRFSDRNGFASDPVPTKSQDVRPRRIHCRISSRQSRSPSR